MISHLLIGILLILALIFFVRLMIDHFHKYQVTIEVITRNLPKGDVVYVVGNHATLGSWDPGAVALQAQADGIWSGTFTFRKNADVQFKITRGSWETEAVNERGDTLFNHHVKVKQHTLQRIEVIDWQDLSPGKKPPAEAETQPEERITGTVRFHRKMTSRGLQPRDIIVWLPPGYEDHPEARYPVLYMHDGQNIFDPLTAYTGVDWQADDTATRLIETGKMREIIIVGIYNTDERLEEYSPGSKGQRYRRFIIDELKPFIDKTYRTRPEREHTGTIGSSMGGLVSFLLVWHHSEVFSMAGCMSPSFIYAHSKAIKALKKEGLPANPVRIYLDCGGVGGERLLYKGCKKVIRLLSQKGIAVGKSLLFVYEKEANHSESAWAKRLWRPLLFMYAAPGHPPRDSETQ